MEDEIFVKEFRSRLMQFAREKYDMGQTYFEELTGLSSGTISAGKKKGMSVANLAKIAARCPELNLRWLLLGEGEMAEAQNKPPRAGDFDSTVSRLMGVVESQQRTIECLVAGRPKSGEKASA